ncbi:MAG: Sensor histidine kinase, partial [Actinomyces urogenitalis DORA_12]
MTLQPPEVPTAQPDGVSEDEQLVVAVVSPASLGSQAAHEVEAAVR